MNNREMNIKIATPTELVLEKRFAMMVDCETNPHLINYSSDSYYFQYKKYFDKSHFFSNSEIFSASKSRFFIRNVDLSILLNCAIISESHNVHSMSSEKTDTVCSVC
ncbi:hypothetical protein SDC9_208110 [bioreactor metagenome]|uniref:Uncharacterized protein n=1 Tax=bioreactor metagenome TaxID=1076179 RepID=A0A645JB73_9ZZZZ